MKTQTDNSGSDCSLQDVKRFEGNAKASPYYARLLTSTRAGQTRRIELAKFLQARRKRLAFEDALRTVAAAE